MVAMLIQCYSIILLSIITSALVLFITGSWLILKRSGQQQAPRTRDVYAAISGEDVVATQLDLARAYIETNKKNEAKVLLKFVMREGNHPQKKEARQLLKAL